MNNTSVMDRTKALEKALRDNVRGNGNTLELDYDERTGCFVPAPVNSHPATGTRLSPSITGEYGCDDGAQTGVTPKIYGVGSGLIETDIFKDKTALVIGVGSLGADIAMQTALGGVGGLMLCDPDTVEASNLSRLRDCVISDVGRPKVEVIRDRILGHNPQCRVEGVADDVTADAARLDAMVNSADVVICATDNRVSRRFVATSLARNGKPGVFTRCSTRAESGDVFISRPGAACWGCMFGAADLMPDDKDDFVALKKAGKLAAYMRPDDMGAYAILPGLYSDLTPISSFAAKTIFWILGETLEENPFRKFEDDVFAGGLNYFIYVNRRERQYLGWAEFQLAGARPCANRWYGARIDRSEACGVCGLEREQLDDARDVENQLDVLLHARGS